MERVLHNRLSSVVFFVVISLLVGVPDPKNDEDTSATTLLKWLKCSEVLVCVYDLRDRYKRVEQIFVFCIVNLLAKSN